MRGVFEEELWNRNTAEIASCLLITVLSVVIELRLVLSELLLTDIVCHS